VQTTDSTETFSYKNNGTVIQYYFMVNCGASTGGNLVDGGPTLLSATIARLFELFLRLIFYLRFSSSLKPHRFWSVYISLWVSGLFCAIWVMTFDVEAWFLGGHEINCHKTWAEFIFVSLGNWGRLVQRFLTIGSFLLVTKRKGRD